MKKPVLIALVAILILAGLIFALTRQPAAQQPPATGGNSMETQNPAKITGTTWHWVKTQMNDDTTITPAQDGAFTITFTTDGKVNGTTDCNNFFGSYTLDGQNLSFGALASTKKYCPNAQEDDFLKTLGQIQSYMLDKDKNQLVLLVAYDSGSMIFER